MPIESRSQTTGTGRKKNIALKATLQGLVRLRTCLRLSQAEWSGVEQGVKTRKYGPCEKPVRKLLESRRRRQTQSRRMVG